MGQSHEEHTSTEGRDAKGDRISSHEAAHMSDAELLGLYKELFAHSVEGRDPYSYGQSLDGLFRKTDEQSLVGQELVSRYADRYVDVHNFLEHQLSSTDTPGVTIRLLSNHDVESARAQWHDPVAQQALAAFTAAISVEGQGTTLVFLGGFDFRSGEVLTLHEFAARHGNEASARSEPGLEEPGFWASLAVGMITPNPFHFDLGPVGSLMMGKGEVKDFIVAGAETAIESMLGGFHGSGEDPITSYSLLFLARDAALQQTSEQRIDDAPTYDDLAHAAVNYLVQVATDSVPSFEHRTEDPVDYGDGQAGQLHGEHATPPHPGPPWDAGPDGLALARPGPDLNEPAQGPRQDDSGVLQMYPGIEAGPLRDDSTGAVGSPADAHGGVGTPDAHLAGPDTDAHGGVGTPDAHLTGPDLNEPAQGPRQDDSGVLQMYPGIEAGPLRDDSTGAVGSPADAHGGVGTPDAHLAGPDTDAHGGVGTPDAHLAGPDTDAHGGTSDQAQDTYDPGVPP